MKKLLALGILFIEINNVCFSPSNILLQQVGSSFGRNELGKIICLIAQKMNRQDMAEYFGLKTFGNNWRNVVNISKSEEDISVNMKETAQALNAFYREAQKENREDVLLFMDSCGLDKYRPPYASLVDATPADQVAIDLEKYYEFVFARQYCNAALKNNKSEFASYIGKLLHGEKWEEKINQPHPLTDAVRFELENRSAMTFVVKMKFLKEIKSHFEKEGRKDIEDFIHEVTPKK